MVKNLRLSTSEYLVWVWYFSSWFQFFTDAESLVPTTHLRVLDGMSDSCLRPQANPTFVCIWGWNHWMESSFSLSEKIKNKGIHMCFYLLVWFIRILSNEGYPYKYNSFLFWQVETRVNEKLACIFFFFVTFCFKVIDPQVVCDKEFHWSY